MDHKTRYYWGLLAEVLSMLLLMCKGFRILKWRYKSKVGEIDIVAKRFKSLRFIEVKARQDLVTAAESIPPWQRQRIEKTAEYFLMRNQHLDIENIQFDAMLVTPWRIPKHIKDAWRPKFN